MVYTVHDPRLFYDAIASRLATTGKPVGEAISPGQDYPYSVIYPMTDIAQDGSLSDPTNIAVYQFQVTAVGLSMEQAQWMQEKVREVLLGFAPTVAGMGTTKISLETGSGIIRDDDGPQPVFSSVDRFRMYASA